MLDVASFFDLEDFAHAELFDGCEYVWDALQNLKTYVDTNTPPVLDHERLCDGMLFTKPLILYNGKFHPSSECGIKYGSTAKGELTVIENGQVLENASVIMAGAILRGRRIAIGSGVLIESGAMVQGPTIIGDHSEIRQGAYIRGNCVFGKRCVVGHSTEVKHSIFLNDAKAGHFNYLGDSILGCNTNLGAGTKFANLRFLPGNVQVKTAETTLDSGLRKFGAILGDRVQTGCNSVTNPGTVAAPDCIIMPNTTAPSGYHQPRSVIR